MLAKTAESYLFRTWVFNSWRSVYSGKMVESSKHGDPGTCSIVLIPSPSPQLLKVRSIARAVAMKTRPQQATRGEKNRFGHPQNSSLGTDQYLVCLEAPWEAPFSELILLDLTQSLLWASIPTQREFGKKTISHNPPTSQLPQWHYQLVLGRGWSKYLKSSVLKQRMFIILLGVKSLTPVSWVKIKV